MSGERLASSPVAEEAHQKDDGARAVGQQSIKDNWRPYMTLSEGELRALSVAGLKEQLRARGVDYRTAVEKSDLRSRLRGAQDGGALPTERRGMAGNEEEEDEHEL